MIYSSNFSVILDACVLYPAPLRDLLLSIAEEGLYKPKWSDQIHKEWVWNLLKNRPDLNENHLTRTVALMNGAFPDALVHNYDFLIPVIELPDLDDRHVVAAAIKSNSDLIVTLNLKDFPMDLMKQYNIDIQDPDTFLNNLYDLNPGKVNKAIYKMRNRLTNPPKTHTEIIETLAKSGLKDFLNKLNS